MAPDPEKTMDVIAIGEVIDPAREKKLLAKLDTAFVPIIMLTYLCCFLDRSNIGNVRVAGMPEDIGASNEQFSIAISIFFATYVLSESPWAIAMKKLTPRYLITGLCLVWSLATVFTAFVSSPGGLYAARLVLGSCEGGLFPALNLYLTMVYKREEMARRVAYLFVCTAIAGAFGGLLAYGILQMDGVQGLAGWKWVYIIEGLFSIVVAAIVFFGLPNDPSNAYFLNEDDKIFMQVRARQRAAYMGSEHFSWNEVKIAVTDPKVLLSGSIQFCQDILLYGFSTFLPSIIRGMGYSTLAAQYLTIPVYIVGGGAFLVVAYFSDKYSIRGPFIAFANMFGIIGYILIICPTPNGVKYLGCFLCAISVYNGPGLNMSWLNVNVAPQHRRAAAIGFQQTIGNTAGIVSGQIYRKSPYVLGNSFSLGSLVVAQILIGCKWLYLRHLGNVKRRIAAGEPDTRRVQTGDAATDFEYHL